jgi:hypothetical protein
MAYLRPPYGPWERHRSSQNLLFFVPVRSRSQKVRTLAAFAAEIRHELLSEINIVNHKVGKPPRHRLCVHLCAHTGVPSAIVKCRTTAHYFENLPHTRARIYPSCVPRFEPSGTFAASLPSTPSKRSRRNNSESSGNVRTRTKFQSLVRGGTLCGVIFCGPFQLSCVFPL